MKTRLARCAAFGLILAVGSLAPRCSAHGAEPKGPVAKPVVFMSAASIERLIGEFDYILDSIERPDTSKKIRELRESATRLKGMGLDRPVGVMLLLDNFTPQTIGFIPVENRDDFIDTLESYELGIEETDENEYLVRGGPKPLFAVVRDRYAYVSDVQDALKRKLPNPEEYAKKLHSDYDFAVTGQLTAVPDYARVFGVEAVRAQLEQQRKQNEGNETETGAQAKAKRVGEKAGQDAVLALMKEADQITLGWSLSRQEQQMRLDLLVTGMKGSGIARQFNGLKATRSEIASFLSSEALLGASATFEFNATFREIHAVVLECAREGAENAAKGKGEEGRKLATRVGDMFSAALPQESIDLAWQVDGEPGKLLFLLAWRSPDPAKLGKDVEELLVGSEIVKTGEHRGAPIYQLGPAGQVSEAMFGAESTMQLCITPSATWLVVGEQAVPALKSAIDRINAATAPATQRSPLEVTLHAGKLEKLDPNQDEEARALVKQALSKGDDRIRLDLNGIENGMRLRLSFGDVFVRAIGLGVVQGLEQQGLLPE